eukprot:6177430-Pleurochrysis_carterae.AAC.1
MHSWYVDAAASAWTPAKKVDNSYTAFGFCLPLDICTRASRALIEWDCPFVAPSDLRPALSGLSPNRLFAAGEFKWWRWPSTTGGGSGSGDAFDGFLEAAFCTGTVFMTAKTAESSLRCSRDDAVT